MEPSTLKVAILSSRSFLDLAAANHVSQEYFVRIVDPKANPTRRTRAAASTAPLAAAGS